MLLGSLKALLYVRFSAYMWTLTLQYVDTYLARFFQYVDTYLANVDKKNVVHIMTKIKMSYKKIYNERFDCER